MERSRSPLSKAPSLHLSKGNTKTGHTLSVSLPPELTCIGMPCRPLCYAMKARCAQAQTKHAWLENYRLWNRSPSAYFDAIDQALHTRRKPGFFRWHVGGEVPSQAYLESVRWIARVHPLWSFALYTKRFDLDWTNILNVENLHVRFSCWPSIGVMPPSIGPLADVPTFWTLSKGQRLSSGFKCPGRCADCRQCWSRKHRSIWITRH
jgi:hypothetical protein